MKGGLSSENNDSSDDSLGSFNPNLENWNKNDKGVYDPSEFLAEYDGESAESDYASHDDEIFNQMVSKN